MKIGRYTVVKSLGKGGMSEVFEVEDPAVGSHHALKLFSYPKDDEFVKARFETEGRLLAKLSHPRIVKVTDIGVTDNSRPYFVMDLVRDAQGEIRTLGDVQDGEADEATVGRWYDDIRDGLAYIHGMGVIHRDLKLQNVMIGPDGHVVIADFGISRIFDPKGGEVTVVDPVQTIVRMRNGQNLVMGSVGYMAPELEMGMPATPKSDWYALGVIIYKLLTGTWCDARSDVTAMLESYDPVWSRILPKLLHSNPQGRECLSYAEERAKDIERREFEWEEKYLREKGRGHFARHIARYVGALSILLAFALAWVIHDSRTQREVWQLRLSAAGARPAVPSFDELFRVPSEAGAEEQTDDNGNTVMASRSQFEAARIDALVLTHDTVSALERGDITPERAVAEFERLCEQLDEDSDVSPFDNLSFGGNEYMQFGDTEPLRELMARAAERLRQAAER